jgi:hypothetical protein
MKKVRKLGEIAQLLFLSAGSDSESVVKFLHGNCPNDCPSSQKADKIL